MKKIITTLVSFSIVLAFIGRFCDVKASALSAKSAIVVEASTGIVVYEHNADEVLPEASTTKIMTALLAIENCSLDSVFTVSKEAANVEGSQIGLFEGDKVKLSDLLFMLMLKSGNDAAHAIAEGVAGSVDDFIAMMNLRAQQLGCTSTNFTNPHGLPDEYHFTTARDLARIACEAYRNDTFRKIASSHKAKLNYGNLVLENSNKLLDMYEYANGMKTGFTKAAGRCLVSSAEKDGISLICVTLNASDDWNDHIALLDKCFALIEKTVIFNTGEYKATVPSLGGDSPVEVINTEPVYGLSIDGYDVNYLLTANIPICIFAPVDAGKTVGRLVVKYGKYNIDSVPLAVKRTVSLSAEELTFYERFISIFLRIWS